MRYGFKVSTVKLDGFGQKRWADTVRSSGRSRGLPHIIVTPTYRILNIPVYTYMKATNNSIPCYGGVNARRLGYIHEKPLCSTRHSHITSHISHFTIHINPRLRYTCHRRVLKIITLIFCFTVSL